MNAAKTKTIPPASRRRGKAPGDVPIPRDNPQPAKLPKPVILLPEHASGGPVRRVPIRLHAESAQRVLLTGTFTNWSSGLEMSPDGDGTWYVELTVPPGRYEYRFVVDGEWANGPSADGYVENPFGTVNCVLTVE